MVRRGGGGSHPCGGVASTPPNPPPLSLFPLAALRSLSDISHLEAAGLCISDSRYEKPNAFGDHARPSGIKANFR